MQHSSPNTRGTHWRSGEADNSGTPSGYYIHSRFLVNVYCPLLSSTPCPTLCTFVHSSWYSHTEVGASGRAWAVPVARVSHFSAQRTTARPRSRTDPPPLLHCASSV